MIIIRYLLSSIYYLVFGSLLLIMHPLQWLGNNLFGYKGHKFIVDIMNFLLVQSLKIVGVTTKFENKFEIPDDKPIVFVSNHQSLYDISAMASHFNKYHVKFVAKIELGNGIPSISYNLKHGGSALIDRKDKKQALTVLRNFGQYLEKNNYASVIYPEGTRSKNGKPKRFSKNGVQMILKYAPSAVVIPVTINNSWKVVQNGVFPLSLGHEITFTLHEPITNGSMEFDELFHQVEQTIINHIK